MIKHMIAGCLMGVCLFFTVSSGKPMVKPQHIVDWSDDIERDAREIMGPPTWKPTKEETHNGN